MFICSCLIYFLSLALVTNACDLPVGAGACEKNDVYKQSAVVVMGGNVWERDRQAPPTISVYARAYKKTYVKTIA